MYQQPIPTKTPLEESSCESLIVLRATAVSGTELPNSPDAKRPTQQASTRGFALPPTTAPRHILLNPTPLQRAPCRPHFQAGAPEAPVHQPGQSPRRTLPEMRNVPDQERGGGEALFRWMLQEVKTTRRPS